jgi:hypothetical protein
MQKTILCVVGAALLVSTGVSLGADPMSNQEASPTLKERITKDAIKGTLTKTEGEYYYIRDDDGKEVRVHVNASTKMDKVIRGDLVKAYITDQGHVTTLQRLEKQENNK